MFLTLLQVLHQIREQLQMVCHDLLFYNLNQCPDQILLHELYLLILLDIYDLKHGLTHLHIKFQRHISFQRLQKARVLYGSL